MEDALLPQEGRLLPRATPGINHVYCECNRNVSLCGHNITDWPEAPEDTTDPFCAVCDDLLDTICERCGT